MLISLLFFTVALGVLARIAREEKEMKGTNGRLKNKFILTSGI
jgi:hypothetical protein